MRFIFLLIAIIIGVLLFVTTIEAEAPTTVLPDVTPCDHYKQLIRQYDWNDEVAISIMLAESSCDPLIVNDNPATKDYSVGLFQVNLYGANAKYRPSEEELKDPKKNIEFAYNLWKSSGFQSQWGVCRRNVSCYN